MKCDNCQYIKTTSIFSIDGELVEKYNICDITHVVSPKQCPCLDDKDNVDGLHICYNCSNWIGGGDWGLSCKKDYYKCTSNGFSIACNKFEQKK